MSDNNDGSFLNGFTVGLLAGAVGYFLFGTNKGTDVRKNLAAEWEKAKGELEKEGVIEEGRSLKEMITGAINKISDSAKTQIPNNKSQPKSKSKISNSKKTTKKKFKGV